MYVAIRVHHIIRTIQIGSFVSPILIYFSIIWPHFDIECLKVMYLHRFPFVTPLILLLLFPFGALGKSIVCDEGVSHGCYRTTIDCGITDSCNIYCNSTFGCDGSTIICNQTNQCALQCSENMACDGVTLFCGEECTINSSSNAFRSGTVHLPNSSKSTIVCNGLLSCGQTNFVVGYNSIVNAQCDGKSSCQSMTMNVSSDSSVDLQCEDSVACLWTTINASLSHNTSLNMTCHGDNTTLNVCYEAAIIGGVNSSIDMSCLNALSGCRGAKVYGDTNSSINVICSGSDSHYWKLRNPIADCTEKMVGGKGSRIDVSCTGYANCSGMELDGRDAASLTLSNCTGNVTCDEMIIWCPQQMSNGEKKCILEGGDNLQIDSLYAVNSWDDIEFNTPKRCHWDVSTMYCTEYYNASCTFGGADIGGNIEIHKLNTNSEWQCVDNSSRCSLEQPSAAHTYICPSTEDNPQESSDLTAVEIVIIVICSAVGVLLAALIIWAVVRKRSGNAANADERAHPLSDESDVFIQSEEQRE